MKLVTLLLTLVAAEGFASEADLAGFREIKFEKIVPTIYSQDGDALKMVVAKSSSFLLKSFEKPLSVKEVSFEWRTEGSLAKTDAESEKMKGGDDGKLKVGLMLAGKAPMMPFFAPGWIKSIRDYMKLPTDRLQVLIVGASSPPGTKWESPYGGGMEFLAVASVPAAGGWQISRQSFGKALDVVGLWLMADGDDTGSSFSTWLRKLELK